MRRREFVATSGAVGVGAVAGCIGDDGGPPLPDDQEPIEADDVDSTDEAAEPCEIAGRLTEDTTLGGECSHYRVTDRLRVDGGVLTVEPGVTLSFDPGTTLLVGASGALSARGTSADPITVAGVEAERGSWGGIVFQNAGSTQNAMEHVIVRHGGSATPRTGPANVRLEGTMADPSRLVLVGCELRDSAGYGLYVDQWSTLEESGGNVLTGNAMGAAYVHSTSADSLDDETRYSGNDHDVVYVEGSRIPTESVHWPTIDVPYELEGRTRVDGGDLTIAAGNTLRFRQDAYLEVAPGQGDAMGRLTAVGTPDEPIVFTGTEAVAGHWQGLAFHDAEASGSRIEHAVIEYGGSSAFPMAEPAAVAVIAMSRDSELDLVNVTLGPSTGHCLFLGPYPDADRRQHHPIVNQENVVTTGCGGA